MMMTALYRHPVATRPGGVEEAMGRSHARVLAECQAAHGADAIPSISWHVVSGWTACQIALRSTLAATDEPGVAHVILATDAQQIAALDQVQAHLTQYGDASILVTALGSYTFEEATP